MPEILEQLQAVLKPLKIHLAPARDGDPLASLMPFKEDYPKYALDEAGNIIGLNLARTELTDGKWQEIMDIPGLVDHLQALNLCENELMEIHIPATMTALRFLNLSENKNLQHVDLQEMSPSAPLEWLDLSECAITTFFFSSFSALQKLDISRNKLTKFFIQGNCPKLFLLDVSGNQLTTFELYGAFEALKYLYLNDNQIETLGFKLVLNALEILHLRNNKLERLPDLLSFTRLEALYLHGNPLPAMRDVISGEERGNSWDAVRAYLQSQRKSGLRYLHQAKMVLVGNGEVGKSSIRIRLLDKSAPLPEKHERTPGLDIQPYIVGALKSSLTKLPEAIDFQLNIWDFGGQGKYREVQQLFCGRKTLYLFVTAYDDQPQKEDYVGFEYWLSMVNAYSFDDAEKHYSPVIHVVNKIDEQEQHVNRKDLIAIFPNIARFVQISCKAPKNFDQLETAIREVLPEVSPDVFTAQFTEFWLAVKTELERRQAENHISKTEYLRICADNNLDENEANNWIRILDRIGTVIYFGESPDLQDWVILNPIWAKDALYKVLDSTLAAGGILNPKLFPAIWQDYSPDEHQHLVKLMLAYKLCYQQKDARGEPEYVVPALLHDTAPDLPNYLQIPDYQLKFTFSPFIPAGTVNKLMVMLHEGNKRVLHTDSLEHSIEKMERPLQIEVNKDYMWKNNVIARDTEHNTYAHVREDWESKSVYLDLFGKEVQALYDHIRQMLESINQALISTKYLTHLHFESWAWHENDWETLVKLKKFGIDYFPEPAVSRHVGFSNKADKDRPRTPKEIPTVAYEPLDLHSSTGKTKILFIAANPDESARLNTNREHRRITEQLQKGEARDRFDLLYPLLDVTISGLIQAMNAKPNIVHFAGHGSTNGIYIIDENNQRRGKLMPTAALQNLFKQLRGKTQIVVLNACYSADQAKVISEFGMYVVGNNLEIVDDTAISFSMGFYNGLGAGKSFENSFTDGLTAVLHDNPAAAGMIEVWLDGVQLNPEAF